MKINNYLAIALGTLLAGCTSTPELEFATEPLTGQECCTAQHKLFPAMNSHDGEFILKYSKPEGVGQKSAIRGILKIAHYGKREYNVNPHETLNLFVDGKRYMLDIVNSLKEPREEIGSSNSVYLPSLGGSLSIRPVNEVTRRKISFYLSEDLLSKISAAKAASFEISSFNNASYLEGYPIILMLKPENISLIQEFKNKCVNNFLNPSRLEK